MNFIVTKLRGNFAVAQSNHFLIFLVFGDEVKTKADTQRKPAKRRIVQPKRGESVFAFTRLLAILTGFQKAYHGNMRSVRLTVENCSV